MAGTQVETSSEHRRVFLAVPIASYLSHELNTYLSGKQEMFPSVLFNHVKDLHITLHYFGKMTPECILKVNKTLTPLVSRTPQFPLKIGGIGYFPSAQAPRIIWAGVKGKTESLIALQKKITSKLVQLDFQVEERPYFPHVTLGRKKRASKVNLAEAMPPFKETKPVEIDRISIYQSTGQNQRPAYEIIKEFSLARK